MTDVFNEIKKNFAQDGYEYKGQGVDDYQEFTEAEMTDYIKSEDWKPTERKFDINPNSPTVAIEVGEDGVLYADKVNEALDQLEIERTTLPPAWAVLEKQYKDICWMSREGKTIYVGYYASDWDSSGAEFDIDDIEYAIECLKHAQKEALTIPTDELLEKFASLEDFHLSVHKDGWEAGFETSHDYLGVFGATPNEALNNLNKEVKNAD